jgi:hypothetical protein
VGRGAGRAGPRGWRAGSFAKTVATEIGEVDLRVPRDRNGTFEPATIPKYTRRLDGLAGNVISLYAKGLTTGDSQTHLLEMYDTEVSRDTISRITDAVVEDLVARARFRLCCLTRQPAHQCGPARCLVAGKIGILRNSRFTTAGSASIASCEQRDRQAHSSLPSTEAAAEPLTHLRA